MSDRLHQSRVGDRDPIDVRAQDAIHRGAVARDLKDHLVLEAKRLRERDQRIVDELAAQPGKS